MKSPVLIIDDDVELCVELAEALEANNMSADTAHTGTDGFNRCMSRKYDAVILDIKLPDMSGIEVFKKIRSSRKEQKIIIITASTVQIKLEGKESDLDLVRKQADAFLAKPFAIPALINLLIQ
ncbi:MAG: response regulator [Elusimicrobia bacterium]|nr:response regulator [Elusimicrobiota bacterium]MBD3412164.1 response regulator [Elusimicrobiota bacterium]